MDFRDGVEGVGGDFREGGGGKGARGGRFVDPALYDVFDELRKEGRRDIEREREKR